MLRHCCSLLHRLIAYWLSSIPVATRRSSHEPKRWLKSSSFFSLFFFWWSNITLHSISLIPVISVSTTPMLNSGTARSGRWFVLLFSPLSHVSSLVHVRLLSFKTVSIVVRRPPAKQPEPDICVPRRFSWWSIPFTIRWVSCRWIFFSYFIHIFSVTPDWMKHPKWIV